MPSARSSGSGGPGGAGTAAVGSGWACTSFVDSWSDKTDGYHYVLAMGAEPSPRFDCHGPTARSVHRWPQMLEGHRTLRAAEVERAWSIDVPHDPRGARRARQQFEAELRDLIPAALLADAVSVVAELLGNAVRHAAPLPGGVIRLSCRMLIAGEVAAGGISVELRVSDGGAEGAPAQRRADPDAIDGRGLTIVAALARDWGVERDGDGQCVWAALGVAPA